MRPFYRFISLFCLLALVACGTEDELTPPAFSNIKVNGVADLSLAFRDANVIITGNVDDFNATVAASNTTIGEVAVAVNSSDGSWSLPFALQDGTNLVSLSASDARGNINQLILTILRDSTPPSVSAVTQSLDPSPQLIVTFNETLLESSLTAVFFSVVNTPVNTEVASSLTGTLAQAAVTLPLTAALPPGTYRLNCPAVTDLAGNVVAPATFDFTITE